MRAAVLILAIVGASASVSYRSEVWTREQEEKAGIVRNDYVVGTAPYEEGSPIFVHPDTLPDAFTWGNKDGMSYLTMSRNQHIPQYCGSCWAHGFASSVGDRIKIDRIKNNGGSSKGLVDINLSVQHVLNCGNAGSCHGGSVVGPFQWMKSISNNGNGLAYETNNPYLACSSESQEGFCPDADFSCNAMNVARTCSTFTDAGGKCVGLDTYPNATLAEFGSISGATQMQQEIMARGPISCGIDALPLLDYTGGVVKARGEGVDHVISVVGWNKDSDGTSYWIVRNSWGEAWGEMGYVNVAFGACNIEENCAWGVPRSYTAPEKNNLMHCYEDGSNCQSRHSLRATA